MVTIAGVVIILIVGTATSVQAKDPYAFPKARTEEGFTILDPITCIIGQRLSNGQCVNSCPKGMQFDSTTGTCRSSDPPLDLSCPDGSIGEKTWPGNTVIRCPLPKPEEQETNTDFSSDNAGAKQELSEQAGVE